MTKQLAFQFCAVLAFSAMAVNSMADNDGRRNSETAGTNLRPVAPESRLQRVPFLADISARIKQVQFQTSSNQNSRQNPGRQNPGQSRSAQGNSLIPSLSFGQQKTQNAQQQPQPAQVQRTQQPELNSRQQRQAAKRAHRRENPGFFRRLFNSITTDEEESEQSPMVSRGEPAPAIPKPPQLNYGQRTSGAPYGSGNRQIAAQPAGYQQRIVKSPPAVPGANSNPQPHPIRRSTQFINPFTDQAILQDNTPLDLDSLLEGPEPLESAAEADLVTVTDDSSRNVAAAEANETSEPAKVPAEGPYTGYRIEDEATVAVQPRREPADSSSESNVNESVDVVAADQQAVQTDADEPTENEIDLPPVDVSAANDLLEPEMQLPSDAPEPLIQTEDSAVTNNGDSAPEESQSLEPPEEISEAADTATAEKLSKPYGRGDRLTSTDSVAENDGKNGSLRVLDSRAKRDQQRYRILSRTGRSGFKGFCPVALRDERELIDSREEYHAKFGLKTYYFSSPDARAAFEANPSRYAPAAGGSDVVLLVNSGEEVSGALDFSLWYRDRLYMFRSRETQRLFAADPSQFADQY